LLHGDDNPGLVRNEEVKYYTLTAQVLAKIIFYNLLPKSGEFSHARGSVPLIIYCLLRGIKINIPKLIISFMTSDHIFVPTRHLPYGMLISYLLKQLNFDLSSVRPSEPSIDINSSLLKRMRVGMRHPAPQQQPIPPAAHVPGSSSASGSSIPSDLHSFLSSEMREHRAQLSAELQEHRTQISAEIQQHHTQISAEIAAHREEMTARYHGLRHDMSYFADSMRYMESQLGALFVRHEVRAPDPTAHARPLPPTGPPFPARTSAPPAPQPAVAAVDSDEEASDEDDDEEDGSEEDGSGSDEDGSESDEE